MNRQPILASSSLRAGRRNTALTPFFAHETKFLLRHCLLQVVHEMSACMKVPSSTWKAYACNKVMYQLETCMCTARWLTHGTFAILAQGAPCAFQRCLKIFVILHLPTYHHFSVEEFHASVYVQAFVTVAWPLYRVCAWAGLLPGTRRPFQARL